MYGECGAEKCIARYMGGGMGCENGNPLQNFSAPGPKIARMVHGVSAVWDSSNGYKIAKLRSMESSKMYCHRTVFALKQWLLTHSGSRRVWSSTKHGYRPGIDNDRKCKIYPCRAEK